MPRPSGPVHLATSIRTPSGEMTANAGRGRREGSSAGALNRASTEIEAGVAGSTGSSMTAVGPEMATETARQPMSPTLTR
jgi:hypothetical protein